METREAAAAEEAGASEHAAEARRPVTRSRLRSAAAVLESLATADERVPRMRVHGTGFDPLDRVVGGGVRPQELTLVGGAPGVGKTIATLQWARHMARQGTPVAYVCYEHDEYALLSRLLSMELGFLAGADNVADLHELRLLIEQLSQGRHDLDELLQRRPMLALAHEAFQSYASNLLLVRGSGSHTGLAEIAALLTDLDGDCVLFVDYLQKVAVRPEPDHESEKVTKVAEGLKDLALSMEIPVVAVVAADHDGLTARRLRLHHLRGSSALAYEADVAILLNEKFQTVSKVHLAYDTVKAEGYKSWAVVTVEKNRGGMAMIDMEFRKDFAHFRFDPEGRHVAERLVDERLDER